MRDELTLEPDGSYSGEHRYYGYILSEVAADRWRGEAKWLDPAMGIPRIRFDGHQGDYRQAIEHMKGLIDKAKDADLLP